VFLFIVWKLPAISSKGKRAGEPSKARGARFIQDFRELFKGEIGLKRWIVISTIRNFGMRIALPFVPLWMVEVKGADPYILGLMGSIGTVTALFLQIPAGRLADRIGRKKVYLLLRPFVYIGTMVLIFAPRPEYLLAVGLLGAVGIMGGGGGGGIGGVSFTPYITMFWEMVPQEKMGRWFGIMGILNIISVPAAVIGGFLWQQGLMMEVLLLPVVLEVCIMIPIFLTIPDTLNRSKESN
jgi:MFS family permease